MENIYIDQKALALALISEELDKVKKLCEEMERLQSIGYGCSQIALDTNKAVRQHLDKALNILLKVKPNGWLEIALALMNSIDKTRVIESLIEHRMEES